MEEILEIKKLLAQDRPEEWDALPDIELYMDQVVSYLPRQSVGGKLPSMTSAMINNYVKDGLLPRAIGKRYQKKHLVYLTAIGLLKNVLTVKDMKLLLDSEIQEGGEEAFYEKLQKGIDEAFDAAEVGLDPELTAEVLRVIRSIFAVDVPAYLEGPAMVSLFAYEKDGFALYPYVSGLTRGRTSLTVKGIADALVDLRTGMRLPPAQVSRFGEATTTFQLMLQQGDVGFYRVEWNAERFGTPVKRTVASAPTTLGFEPLPNS